MKTSFKSLIQLAVCLGFATTFVAQAQQAKIDPTGAWKSSYTNQSGEVRESTVTLKLEGDKVTGAVSAFREGGTDTPISNGTLKGDEIAFDVTRERGGNTMTTKYTGKISGDTIKGKMESQRDGQPQTRDWEAKKVAAKPAAPPAR
jgi:hypothetical protein